MKVNQVMIWYSARQAAYTNLQNSQKTSPFPRRSAANVLIDIEDHEELHSILPVVD